MDTKIAKEFALTEMKKWGLEDWEFDFDKAKQRFGVCYHHKKRITISRALTEINDEEEVFDTILHEIAHALAGHGEGHGKVWKNWCVKVGAKPVRCYSAHNVSMVEGKYRATCPSCCFKHTRHRRPKKRSSCGNCSKVFDSSKLLVWVNVDNGCPI